MEDIGSRRNPLLSTGVAFEALRRKSGVTPSIVARLETGEFNEASSADDTAVDPNRSEEEVPAAVVVPDRCGEVRERNAKGGESRSDSGFSRGRERIDEVGEGEGRALLIPLLFDGCPFKCMRMDGVESSPLMVPSRGLLIVVSIAVLLLRGFQCALSFARSEDAAAACSCICVCSCN